MEDATMTKKERVIAVIYWILSYAFPSSFSLHFPAHEAVGDAAVEAHLKFFEETDTDYKQLQLNMNQGIKGI